MGSLGLDDMYAMVKLRMGQRTDLEEVGDNKLNYYEIWVNQAYRQICAADYMFGIPKKIIIPQLETSASATTTANVAYISRPAGASIIRHVFDETNKYRPRWIPEAYYMNYTDRSTSSAYGNPTEWCNMNNFIYLHPTPKSVLNLTIYYRYIPDDISGDGTTVIGSEWDEPIVVLATYKAHLWLSEFEKAAIIRNELIDLLTAVIPPVHQEERDRRAWVYPDPAYIQQKEW
jgi:hypothetical protein